MLFMKVLVTTNINGFWFGLRPVKFSDHICRLNFNH